MNVFSCTGYKEFLRGFIEARKRKGVVSEVAAYCGCDRTYLSQVLNGKADLTPDHVVRFCDALELDENESRYLMLMLLKDRASAPAARKSFQEKLDKLRRESQALSKKIAAKEALGEIPERLRTLYYSNWLYAAVHTLTSIPEYQTLERISEKLNLTLVQTRALLKSLVEMGVVVRDGERFAHSGASVYLERESPQGTAHHLNWRLRATERARHKEDVHYTGVFTVSRDDIPRLRESVVKLIEAQRKDVLASGTESACVFCCDFFEI